MSPPTGSAAHRGVFDPLPRILFHDDFNRGLCGRGARIGNYAGRAGGNDLGPGARVRRLAAARRQPDPGTSLQALVRVVLKE